MIADVTAARAQKEAAVGIGQQIDIYVVIAKEDRRRDALVQVQALRECNYHVDFPLTPTKIGKQFQTAEALGARVAVLFGDEWPQVAIKNLASGEQENASVDVLASRVESMLR